MDIFQNGAVWLRADFHLHTKADKEFAYSSDENYYLSSYVQKLKETGIGVGVISNHNKFNFDEFKALGKTAQNEGIFLLPGVELSLNDGANGIHVLIVFSEAWWQDGNDLINPLLTSMFPGKTPDAYQNENGRSDKNILQLLEVMQRIGHEYFLIFAHVEDDKGLWKEMRGGRLSDWATDRYQEIRKRTLAFQKVRTRDTREKVRDWLRDWYPAEVEGSDPKAIEQIGQGKKCIIKLGAFTFDAVRFALLDYKNRLCSEIPQVMHSYIQKIEFLGGIFDGKTIHLSPELNTLIGIRGSGKSAVIEIIRYILGISFGENAGDQQYKQALVKYAMGSGGKARLFASNRFGQPYVVERIWNELPSVYFADQPQPGVSIRETVLHRPIYFGQKDLSSTSAGFERDLVEKLVGVKLADVRQRIGVQKEAICQSIDQLLKIGASAERKQELSREKLDITHRLTFYAKHGVEEKLQKRLDYDADLRFIKRGTDLAEEFVKTLQNFVGEQEASLTTLGSYTSKHNPELLQKYLIEYEKVKGYLSLIKKSIFGIRSSKAVMNVMFKELSEIKNSLMDEFAAMERQLASELANENKKISSDDFIKLKNRQAQVEQQLDLLTQQENSKENAKYYLLNELQKLNNLWHEEFMIVKNILDDVSQQSDALKIICEYKADRAAYLNFMKSMFRGSNIREATLQDIVECYPDFIEIYKVIENDQGSFGKNPQIFTEWFFGNLKEFLTYQVPNHFVIMYRGKELKQHSLGQRASALILFILSQNDNDLIMVDQPEDDLDNQTIYDDVIKLICRLKPNIQFILATHNPNIPVLGDAEQILACSFSNNTIHLHSGSIDEPQQQKTIVDIMEGGEEAFKRRRKIYHLWKS
ncbi:MAG: AAA family ATPase [Desulfovibrio sp.]|jgi:ABC-type lipoprotein export system ATPase subunit|nr:AAA family ATPase [Desulfovibrio sp.]